MPSEEIIIADSSPLIGLARIGQLELLPQLAKRIIVPRAVHSEVTLARADAPGAAEVAAQSWIEVLEADPVAVAPLLILVGQGEAEAIALAQRESSGVLLLDDLRARKLAARLGLRRMGTVALLGQAKRERLIPKLKPSIDALVANGFFIREELITAVFHEPWAPGAGWQGRKRLAGERSLPPHPLLRQKHFGGQADPLPWGEGVPRQRSVHGPSACAKRKEALHEP